MTREQQKVKVARKTFQSSLKASRTHYRREKKGLKRSLPKRRFIMRRAEKAETREQRQALKQTYQEEKDLATDTFKEAISYVSPRWLKSKEIKKYRLPQARQRLAVARKHLAEVKMAEKEEAATSKFTYQKKPTESKTSRFQFQKEKPLERLQAEKEVKSAKRDVIQLKKAHQFKNPLIKVKRGLRYVASDSLDVVAQDDDLEGIRTLKESVIKGRGYGRFTYQSGKLLVKSGQTGLRFTKTKVTHSRERYQNFKKGIGFTRQNPLKPRRRYHTFLKQARRHSVSGITGVIQAIKNSLTFFSSIALNLMTWVVSGFLFFLLLMMSFVIGISGTTLIQQDESELTKAYTHMTWDDAENTRTNPTGITYYTKIDDVMGFMNLKYQDYALDEVMEEGDTIFLGPGTTVESFAEEINNQRLSVVTNCLPVFNILLKKKSETFKVFLLGGEMRQVTESFVGEVTNTSLEKMHFSKMFFSANGNREDDVMTSTVEEAYTQRLAISRSVEQYLLLDSSKIGKEDFSVFCQLSQLTAVITDKKDEEKVSQLAKWTEIIN